jgi:hypothetical protein
MSELYEKLPIEIIREHIIPYTYCPQPQNLCENIRNYKSTLNDIHSMYISYYKIKPFYGSKKEYYLNYVINNNYLLGMKFTEFFVNYFKKSHNEYYGNDKEEILRFNESLEFYPYPSYSHKYDININKYLLQMSVKRRNVLRKNISKILFKS